MVIGENARPKRIHPEVIGEDGVSQCQMTSDSYSAKILKAVASLPSFFFLVCERWRGSKLEFLAFLWTTTSLAAGADDSE